MEDLRNLSIKKVQNSLLSGEYSCRELVETCLNAIKRQRELNTFLTVTEEHARTEAELVDAKIERGEPLLALEGIPVAVKDVIITRGVQSTAGSRILEGYIPPYESTVMERLENAGVILLGKTNCDEFAMGASGEHSGFGPTKNPLDITRVPGGSSSGSAAAVAEGQAVFALGTDTGGSVRQPASFCGIVGLKPSYGRVSRKGLIALASSLDQIGPLTTCVEDAARVMNVMAGWDPFDATTTKEPVPDYEALLTGSAANLRIGVPKEYIQEGIQEDVKEAIQRVIDWCRGRGHEVKELSLPHTPFAVATYYLILDSEASTNLARYDGIRFGFSAARDKKKEVRDLLDVYLKSRSQGFGDEVKRRIMLGAFALSAGYYDAYYKKAQQVRTLIVQDFQKAFQEVDCLLTPTSPTTAFKLGEKSQDPLSMYLADIFTVAPSLAGIPGLSVPVSFDHEQLPIGLQILGAPFHEGDVLRLGYTIETQYRA